MRRAVAAPLLAAAAFGCAQPGTPPGGEVDRSPPRVVDTTPVQFDTITDLRSPIVIRFNERLSEQLEGVRDWDAAVVVSPATSPVRVDAGRRRVRISLARGWEPDHVYRVTVRPVFRDLFNNRRTEPIELVFSTGAEIPGAALAGFVRDRLTGRGVADARVEAVRRIDQVTYVALSDTAGFFAMRFMPAGAYDVRAWLDQDRNRERAFFEIQDSVATAFGVRDTAVVELALLPPDTTPARLARAEPVDSSKVRLLFDDYFAPGPVDGEARLYSLPDSAYLGDGSLFHATRLDSLRAAEAEAAAAEAAAADSIPTPDAQDLEEARRRRGDEGGRDAAPRPDQADRSDRSDPLPSQTLVLLVPGLLQPDSAYFVVVEGVTNINGVAGGGGTVEFLMPPEPPPPSAADTTAADTAAADTVPAIEPDTVPGGDLGPGFRILDFAAGEAQTASDPANRTRNAPDVGLPHVGLRQILNTKTWSGVTGSGVTAGITGSGATAPLGTVPPPPPARRGAR